MAALAQVNSVMIQVMVQGESSAKRASSREEMMPLPYCNEPMRAEADPADVANFLQGSRRGASRHYAVHGEKQEYQHHYAQQSGVAV